MTYFSKFEINPQRRASRKLITNPRAMHASVLSLFAPDSHTTDERVLWRLDNAHPRHTLYVVSPEKPDFSHLTEQAGWKTSPGQSADYTRFLQRVTTGSEWLFTLQANPTKALRQEGKPGAHQRGTIIPLVTEEQQITWFQQRTEQWGFKLHEVTDFPGLNAPITDLRVVENREQVAYKHREGAPSQKVTLRKAVFEGRLIVTDDLALRRALVGGIGRAKSYGYGMLTLRKP
ncbi:type I-E CRISPR-associated protein Cas6/Cse3/CasE [Leucobacter chinensis]|uniref:type I-E CRISPR-associated protein Cas6/Cse3/CasE n=1 Tax=Leucobacter chinensis TaxID=2851010 RepID=UPI001C23DF46|nr:type I-E CRISPR-associated protein Cas6/Cse3/CasE [Leucobacter chinensis]